MIRFEPSPILPAENLNSLSKVKVKRREKNCCSTTSFTGAGGKTPKFNRGKFQKFYSKVIKNPPPAVGGTGRKKIPSVEGSEFLGLLYLYSQFSSTSAIGNVWSRWLLVLCSSCATKKTLKKSRVCCYAFGPTMLANFNSPILAVFVYAPALAQA